MTPEIKVLQDLKWQLDCSKTNMPPSYVPKDKFSDKTANSLTKCIVTWININGGIAERISSAGRMIDNTKVVSNVLGQKYRIGSFGYIPGTSRNGTADVSATFRNIHGQVVSWKIEVKIGKDKQSEAQKQYQQDTEKAGGVYTLARSFSEFIKDYKRLMESPST